MNRLIALGGVLILLLGCLGFAWQSGYFEDKQPRTVRVGEFLLEPDQPWEIQFKKELDRAEAGVDLSLLSLAPVEFRELQFPTDNQIHLQKDASRRLQKFLLSEVDAYKQRTKDPAAAQEKAVQFLEASMEVRSGVARRKNYEAANKFGQEALEAGCQDRTIKFLLIDQTDKDWKDNIQPAIDDVLTSNPSRFIRTEAYDAQFRLWKLTRKAVRGIDPINQMLDGMVAWAEECNSDPVTQVYLYGLSRRLYSDSDLKGNHQAVYRAFAKAQHAPAWLRHMIAGVFHNDVAWSSRGAGWQVDPQRGHYFSLELDAAARHLSYAWHLMPEYPHAASYMISVTLGGVDRKYGSPTTWFYRATNARLDFEDAYGRYITSLYPRWGGSIEDLIQFAKLCVETRRFDTFVPGRATPLLFNIQKNELGQARKIMDLPAAQEVVRLYEELHPFSSKEPATAQEAASTYPFHDISVAALYAQARKLGAARRVLQNEKEPIEDLRNELTGLWEPAELVASAVFASADDEPFVKSMLDKFNKGFDFNQPADELKALLTGLESLQAKSTDAKAKPFFQHSIAVAKRALAFQSDDWTPLNFENEAAGWSIDSPHSRIVDDNTLWLSNVTTTGERVMNADLLNRVPLPFVIEFDLAPKIVSAPIGMIGAFVGDRDFHAIGDSIYGSRLFGLDAAYKTCAALSPRDENASLMMGFFESPPYRLKIKCWRNWYTLYVNGIPYVNQADNGFNPAPRLCLGSGYKVRDFKEMGEVTISNVRLRKINYDIPPTDLIDGSQSGLWEAQERYHKHELELDPDDVWAMYSRGRALHMLNRPTEALPLLLESLRRSPSLDRNNAGLKIAKCYEMLGDYENALRHFREHHPAHTRDPDFAREYGFFLAACPEDGMRNGKEALAVIDPNCNSAAGVWADYMVKSAALAELGDFEQAMKMIDLADNKAKASEKNYPSLIQKCRAEYLDRKPFRFERPEPK